MNGRIVSGMAVGTVVAIMALVAAAGGASATPASGVNGGGAGALDSDRVQVQLNARGTDGGRFNIVHHTPDGIFAHLAGHVDCVAVTGSTAVVTGTITEGFDDLGIDPVGERVSLVIHDQEVDSVEMDVSFVSGHTIPPCSAEPILTVVIADGQFKVRP